MFPLFSSLSFNSNGNASSGPQSMPNPGSFAANPIQNLQMGFPNPQTASPFSNSNALFVPNQLFPMQAPQCFNNPVTMNQMNNINVPNPVAQIFNQNSANPSQFLNQNLNLGLGFPNQMQNMNQIFPMQLPHLNGQAVPGNFSIPQSLTFLASNPLGIGNGSGSMQHPGNMSALQAVQAFTSFPPQQKPNNFQPPPPNSQGNNRNQDMRNRNGRNLWKKNLLRNPKHEGYQDRCTKSQVHNFQYKKGNFKSHHMQSNKGNGIDEGKKTYVANSGKQAQVVQKRRILLNYTEQEIQQWREERRKNYPSNANIEKKLMEKLNEPGIADLDAKLRRQQLKEILAKQAELGCEVAEIPECYLSVSEKRVHGRKDNVRALSKKGKFQNKFNKRGRVDPDDRFSRNHVTSGRYSHDHLAKKQKVGNNDSVSSHAPSKREPTLLQKLLSADIRRDKQHLLQVFRFMVMNCFFKDWPRRPLKFPVVAVKETGDEDVFIEGMSQETEEYTDINHGDNIILERVEEGVQAGEPSKLQGRFQVEENAEEEGEIID